LQEGETEEETDKLVQQVFLEIGLTATEGMVSAPNQAVAQPEQQQQQEEQAPEPIAEAEPSGVDADLEARLNALRRS
jgi:hypothetical protein